MSEGQTDLLSFVRDDHTDQPEPEVAALPLRQVEEPLVTKHDSDAMRGEEPLVPQRALVPADFRAPRTSALDAALRWAYRIGVPGSILSAPLRKTAQTRFVGTVESRLTGDRMAGMALRAGHFLVAGAKIPVAKADFSSPSKLTQPVARALHGFTWMRDLAACAPRTQCAATAGAIFSHWSDANPEPGRGPAWTVENAGLRLLNWIVHAPLVLSGEGAALSQSMLDAIETTARWLDRHVGEADDRLAQSIGWGALVAAGLLLRNGRPRRLFAEAGLLRSLGEAVGDDGGVLARSPAAQMEAIALMVELRACYEAVGQEPPAAIDAMPDMLVPALLSLRMGDRGLGSWQGGMAFAENAVDELIMASRVRARPMIESGQWGYQRARSRDAVLVMDAAPPPKRRHARAACASTLAFEFSHGRQRIIVNCGGAEAAGTLVPARIEQGLRGTAAHSTLSLDDANSTAIHLHGQIGKGVEEVEFSREILEGKGRKATRFEASHDGYGSRYGLLHRRILVLSDDGEELHGEDAIEPSGRRGNRGKIAFALRFHLGLGIDASLTEDSRGVHLALPDASYWQFRLGGDNAETQCAVEDSLWVDGQGRPHGVQQIVVEGLTDRRGARFPWLLKRMG